MMDMPSTFASSHLVHSSIFTPPILEEQNSPIDGDSISCYVTLPDGLVIEVCLPRNSKGIKCLDETCRRLDIVEEDYFGLRYEGPKGELLWLNMRNKISKQMRHSRWKTVGKHQAYRCFRLQFRVKFFVPCHMLLQDSTRTQFYLNLRNSFLDGDFIRHAHTGTLSQNDISALYALIAQVELTDFDNQEAGTMKALYQSQLGFRPHLNSTVSTATPSDTVIEEPEAGSSESHGSELSSREENDRDSRMSVDEDDVMLDAVYEAHRALKGMRRKAALYKFLEEIGKLEDYGYEYHLVENSQYENVLVGVGPDAIRMCKLNTAMLGNACCQNTSRPGRSDSLRFGRTRRDSESDCGKPAERTAFLRLGRGSRRRLFKRPAYIGTSLDSSDVHSEPEPEPAQPERRPRVRNNTESSHRSRNNSESSGSDGPGRRNSESDGHSACKLLKVALEGGRLEKALRDLNPQRLVGDTVDRYPYAVVSRARVDDRVMFLTVAGENGLEREFGSRCTSSKAAIGLYRAITERHTFYRCDSIRDDVVAQTKRDFRGTIASLFSEVAGSGSCPDFVFDIARTSREAFDHAKRALFRRERERSGGSREPRASTSDADNSGDDEQQQRNSDSEGGRRRPQCDRDPLLDELAQLREQLHARDDNKLCRVCMDVPKQVAFEPCGHFCLCLDCSNAVKECPFCRAPIAKSIRIYEPCTS